MDRIEFKTSMQINSLIPQFVLARWNLPIQVVQEHLFPYTAYKKYEECVVWAEVDWNGEGPWAEVTFSWPSDVDQAKSNQVLRRLKERFGYKSYNNLTD